MKALTVIFVVLFLSVLAQAQQAPSVKPSKEILNQILFSEGSESWTARDLALYKKVIGAYFKEDKISEYSDSALDDFIISRLLKREALLFEIHPQEVMTYNTSKLGAGEFSKKEIEGELKDLSYAVALLNLKEKQMAQKARFRAWIDVLKRKYQVKIKVNEFT